MPLKSKQKISCAVDICKKEGRADKIKEHYKNFVVCDKDGNPLDPASSEFKKLSGQKRVHTPFFLQMAIVYTNSRQVPSSLPKSPWAAMNIDLPDPVPGQSGEKEKTLDDLDEQLLDDQKESPRKKSKDDGMMIVIEI